MKRIIALIFALTCFCVADSSYNGTVTTNSTIVVPYADASGISVTAWATGTAYDQGDYVRVSNARYWTSNGGTSTNQPSHIEGKYTYADGVTWVRITNTDRRNVWISNLSQQTMWLAFGGTDVAVSNGVPLYSEERVSYEGQREVRAIVASGTAEFSVGDEDEE